MLQFSTTGNVGNPTDNISTSSSGSGKPQKQISPQQRKAKRYWGVQVKESNVDTVLNLMFSHLGDPQRCPNPMVDPSGRR